MQVEKRRNGSDATPRQRQKGRQVQHIGGQDQVGLGPLIVEAPSQRDGPAMHAPLPVASRQGQQLHLVTAEALKTFGPGSVTAAMVGRDQ